MNDNDVWRALIAALRNGLDNQGLNAVLIKQAYQGKTIGANSADTIYLHKIPGRRYGFQNTNKKTFNQGNDNFDVEESWRMESTFQLTPQINVDPADESALTSYDVANICTGILKSEEARKSLRDAGISIYRITEVRSIYAKDDRDEFDQDANFDFVLSYLSSINSTAEKATAVDSIVERVQ